MQSLENVSTLMDGELDGDEALHEIVRLKTDSSSRASWDAYHLIGDTMRHGGAGTAGAPALSSGFCARFAQRLALEPTVLAPHNRVTRRWPRKVQTYALSAAASVTAMAVVGWMVLSTPSPVQPDAPGALAIAPVQPPVVVVQAPPAAVVPLPAPPPQFSIARDATSDHMHEYLLAHQGISPTTAIQGVTPYIRTVSNTGD